MHLFNSIKSNMPQILSKTKQPNKKKIEGDKNISLPITNLPISKEAQTKIDQSQLSQLEIQNPKSTHQQEPTSVVDTLSFKEIKHDNQKEYIKELFTSGLKLEDIQSGKSIPYQNIEEGVCQGLSMSWLCSDTFDQFQETKETPETKAFIRGVMQMQVLQIGSEDFLGTPEAKELVNLTAAKENPINIEKPNEYILLGDDETDMQTEQTKFFEELEKLYTESNNNKFALDFNMSDDYKNFSGHATGLKITEIDGRKTIHFYDPNYGQMSGEFNEQTVDDIFKILKDYGENFGKNMQLLLYPITKEADAAQQP